MLFILCALTVLVGTAHESSVCPADTPRVRSFVAAYVSDPRYVEVRSAGGLPQGTTLTLLTDRADRTAGERLNQLTEAGGEIGPSPIGPYVFYRAGARYLLVAAPAENALGWTYVGVLDTVVEEVLI